MKTMVIISFLLQTSGLILMIIALILASKYHQMKTKGVQTEAEITAIKKQLVNRGKQVFTMFTPILNYQFRDQIYQGQGPISQGKANYTIGQTILIHLNPKKPEKFIIIGENHNITNILYIFAAGFMLIVLSFYF